MKVIDMHCDTMAQIYREEKRRADRPWQSQLAKNGLCIDLEKMKQGKYLLQNFAMFIDKMQDGEILDTVMGMIDCYERELKANEAIIAPVYTYQDILDNQKQGKLSAMLTLEEGCVVKGSLEQLRKFYRRGVRMITLTWNYKTDIGEPNLSVTEDGMPLSAMRNARGLTEFGLEMIAEMERLGIIIDVSHLSDGGFWDVLHHTSQPFVASHSNAASQCNVCRNLTDDMIRALAERGGVMGLNYCCDFLTETECPSALTLPGAAAMEQGEKTEQKKNEVQESRIADMVRHVQHVVNVGGIEVCGLGSDFDGIENPVEFRDASGLPKLYDALTKAGFSEEQADQIFYKNVLRVYKEVLK